MELKGSDFDRIRGEHLRGVRRHDFAAEQRYDELKTRRQEDNYLGGVVSTCRWTANAGVTFDQPINGTANRRARRSAISTAPHTRS